MSKSKNHKKNNQLFDAPTPEPEHIEATTENTEATPEENVDETATENLEANSDLAEGISVSITYEANPEKPNTVESVMNAKIEVEVGKPDRKLEAVKAFAELWESLPHHNYMTDAQAREVHKLWQAATGRTDYYTNCSVCTINHIKRLKKIAKGYGIDIR